MIGSARHLYRIPVLCLVFWLTADSVAPHGFPAAAGASGAEIPATPTGTDEEAGANASGTAIPAAVAGAIEGNIPERSGESSLSRTLRALEEQVEALNREQRRLLLRIGELRRENREAARRLTFRRLEKVLSRAKPALEEIRSARREWQKLNRKQQAAAGRFRRHRRNSDWKAALDDLSAIVRYGEQAVEQLERELRGELKLMELLRQGGSP
ncbi:MAG: hypothetical protein BAA02_04075 [Paenibacillaceae bacterium ZCTH02-B3]|nr:MAG: hypothetical protein BAA02_04075 [Paenibacillaceae bacterium ZCTH02-B3]